MTWQPHRTQARVAAALGWVACLLVVLALLPWVRSPRSHAPLIALLLSLALLAFNVLAVISLAGLANMH
jgi:hypothetical protein